MSRSWRTPRSVMSKGKTYLEKEGVQLSKSNEVEEILATKVDRQICEIIVFTTIIVTVSEEDSNDIKEKSFQASFNRAFRIEDIQ